MKWDPSEGDSNQVEDRRGESPQGGGGLGGLGGMGGGMRFPGGGMRLGLGGTVLLLIILFVGRNFLGGGGGDPGPDPGPAPGSGVAPGGGSPVTGGNDPDRELVQFVTVVITDVQKTWAQRFEQMGKPYRLAHLVLFTRTVESGCGFASSDMGPFYCPEDQKVNIDLSFYRELKSRFGAPGDFAQAYVIAHEVGHHVQNLLGIDAKVRAAQQRNPREQNELSVRMELQADCFAGIWASSREARGKLDPGDIDEALGAASAVGDDRLQKQATGRVNPETWTHGSAEQRKRWFQRGHDQATIEACDTFSGTP